MTSFFAAAHLAGQAAKRPPNPSEATRYADPTTEWDVYRLTDPAHSDTLPAYYNRAITRNSASLLFASDRTGDWTVTPSAELGYVRFLNHPSATSEAQLYGFTVAQTSAFDSRNLGRAAFDLTASRGPFSVQAGINGVIGGGDSSGIGGRLALGYSF